MADCPICPLISALRDRWLVRVAEHVVSVEWCEAALAAAGSRAERESMSIRVSRAREQERFWRKAIEHLDAHPDLLPRLAVQQSSHHAMLRDLWEQVREELADEEPQPERL